MHGNTVVTAVTVAIGENGSEMAYFSHSAGTAHGAPRWRRRVLGSFLRVLFACVR